MILQISATATWYHTIDSYRGAGPAYAVRASDRDGYQHCQVFEGAGAFDHASAYFEQMKHASSAHELTFLRIDLGQWTFLSPRLRRNKENVWKKFGEGPSSALEIAGAL